MTEATNLEVPPLVAALAVGRRLHFSPTPRMQQRALMVAAPVEMAAAPVATAAGRSTRRRACAVPRPQFASRNNNFCRS